MTVILDPGTDPFSYVDAAVRQWKQTAGLWQADYNAEVTAYNNALAPVAVDHLAANGVSSRQTFAFGLQTVASITFDRTGQWIVTVYSDMTDTSFGLDVHGKCHLIWAGIDVANSEMSLGNGSWSTPQLRVYFQGSANSGQVASVQVANEDSIGGARNSTGFIDAYFIPIRSNPH